MIIKLSQYAKNEGMKLYKDRNEGMKLYKEKIGSRSTEFTLEDYPTKEDRKILMDDKEEIPLKSSGRKIQEENNGNKKPIKVI